MNREDGTSENLQASLAGVVMSSWLPIGAGRKAIMFILLALGMFGLILGNDEMLIYFPIAALFSPRIVGAVAYNAGRIVRLIKGN